MNLQFEEYFMNTSGSGNSRLNDHGPYSREAYANGFKEAASLLASQCDDTWKRNTLIYPVVFNFRHYVELRLKDILISLNFYVSDQALVESPNDIFSLATNCHEPLKIWDRIQLLKKRLSKEDKECIFKYGFDETLIQYEIDGALIKKCVKFFQKIDPKGTTFRYSFQAKKQGDSKCIESSIPDEYEYMEIQKFVEKAEEVSRSLEAISDNIAIALDKKREEDSYLGEFNEC
ncbi:MULTISPECIES: hypothetical protein [unclassified Nitrospina]|uniref:hypothetical protein n=1 Tax=unclassified Nitrospina TaxID=2638683 RepID=UPI003F9B4350